MLPLPLWRDNIEGLLSRPAMRAARLGSRVQQLLPALILQELAWEDADSCICSFLRQKYQYMHKVYGGSSTVRHIANDMFPSDSTSFF